MQSLSALLLCNDSHAIGVTEKVFDEYNFNMSFAGTASDASQLIRRNRFDLAVYDDDVPGAVELAGPQPEGSSPSVVFLMLRGLKTNLILGRRIHVLLPKPFSGDLLAKSLKTAYRVILREKRASFRHCVDIDSVSTMLILQGRRRRVKSVKIVNISQGGMCLDANEMLPQGGIVRLSFRIPESQDIMRCIGTIAWTHQSGRAGVKFTAVLPSHHKTLCAWLDSLLPWDEELRSKTQIAASAAKSRTRTRQ